MTQDKTENVWWKFSEEELRALDATGIEIVKVLKVDEVGDQLLEGESYAGDTLRGKWIGGESAADIRWHWETVDGWPENLSN